MIFLEEPYKVENKFKKYSILNQYLTNINTMLQYEKNIVYLKKYLYFIFLCYTF